MKKNDDVFKKFHDTFGEMEGHFHILDQPVPVNTQMEYFKYSEEIRRKENPDISLDNDKIDALYSLLLLEETSESEKKHLLTTLATSKSVKAYRLLKEYSTHPDQKITDWANMALMESRISLESEFSDEKQIYISTGLGGKDEKLRFYMIVFSQNKQPFKEYQHKVIEREFPYLLEKANCDVERLNIENNYVEIRLLVPIRANIKNILDEIITECNQYGNFLRPLFTITNVRELTKEEIADLLNEDGDN